MLTIGRAMGLLVALCVQSILLPASLHAPRVGILTDNCETSEAQEAKRLWEQAIAAKGGRERLHEVRNMVIASRGEYKSGRLKKNQVRREELLVFPNKYWFRDDYRPDVFGLRISMYNYDTNMNYVISDSEPNHRAEPITNGQRNKALRNDQLSFLLETKWLKPIIVRASTERVGQHLVDVVQTLVEGERVDFAFDQKTHLPVRVSFYDTIRGKTYITTNSFSDYINVGGIEVPQVVKYDDGTEYRQSYQFNVEYNEDIFVNPPPITAWPEAWKVTRR